MIYIYIRWRCFFLLPVFCCCFYRVSAVFLYVFAMAWDSEASSASSSSHHPKHEQDAAGRNSTVVVSGFTAYALYLIPYYEVKVSDANRTSQHIRWWWRCFLFKTFFFVFLYRMNTVLFFIRRRPYFCMLAMAWVGLRSLLLQSPFQNMNKVLAGRNSTAVAVSGGFVSCTDRPCPRRNMIFTLGGSNSCSTSRQ